MATFAPTIALATAGQTLLPTSRVWSDFGGNSQSPWRALRLRRTGFASACSIVNERGMVGRSPRSRQHAMLASGVFAGIHTEDYAKGRRDLDGKLFVDYLSILKRQRLKQKMLKDKKKEKDVHPDYRGSAMINGVEYWISGWVNEGSDGKYLGLKFQQKDAETRLAKTNDDEDVPF